MTESKMLKARCSKTGRYYGLELRKIGSSWKVVNMIDLSGREADIIMSEVRQSAFETYENLIPCTGCGSRRVGGCTCPPKSHPCSARMKYRFDCVYCQALEIDYSRTEGRSPYTQWAGVSNIPSAIKDRYGNPEGSSYDLARDGGFAGYRIVVLNLCPECRFTLPAAALRKKGFEIEEYTAMPSGAVLRKALRGDRTQLWVISDKVRYMEKDHIDLILKFYRDGHGVYVWGDNKPFYADANRLLYPMFGVEMRGNSYGDQVLGIQDAPKSRGIIPNHPITTGLVSFYEGITIAEVPTGDMLTPLIYGSNGKIVAGYYDARGRRALVDGGFTRLYCKWDSAGTDRYVVNAAAWLANIERFGYNG